MSTAQPKTRRRFPGLDPAALQHPYDKAALGALQRVPGLDIVVRKFIELFPERVAYIQNVAQTVRVSPTQCPQLYVQLQEACAILPKGQSNQSSACIVLKERSLSSPSAGIEGITPSSRGKKCPGEAQLNMTLMRVI